MKNNTTTMLIKKVELKIEKIATQILSRYDLTSSQLKILNILYACDDKGMRQIDLERHFSLTNPTVTGILNNMEKKGLIQRIKKPEDNRNNWIVPTEEAMSQKDEMIALYTQIEKTLTENLSNDENQQLKMLLNKILDE